MNAVDIDTQARRFYEEYGPKAMAIAAQRAVAHENDGQDKDAATWRRIEERISELRGAPPS